MAGLEIPRTTKNEPDSFTTTRLFTSTEIKEINRYITTEVPYTILEEVYALTENVLDKSKVFTIMRRIINSAKSYVADADTREKLQKMLDETTAAYNILYDLLLKYQQGIYGRYAIQIQIEGVFRNEDTNTKINKLIDAFLLFAERQTFFDLDKAVGIESGKKEGQEVVNDIIGEEV